VDLHEIPTAYIKDWIIMTIQLEFEGLLLTVACDKNLLLTVACDKNLLLTVAFDKNLLLTVACDKN